MAAPSSSSSLAVSPLASASSLAAAVLDVLAGRRSLSGSSPAADRAIALGLLLSGALVGYQAYRSSKCSPRNCARTPWHPLIGNLWEAAPAWWRYEIHDLLTTMHTDLGKTVHLVLPLQPPTVCTVDPANVEYILKTHFDNFPKGTLQSERMTDLLGSGIFNADGDIWFHQRKTSSQMFTANRFKTHIWRVVQKNTAKVVELLKAADGGCVDVFHLMNRFTLDSIGEIAFAQSIGSLENAKSPFLKSFDAAQRITFSRYIVPGWQVLRVLGLFSEWGAKAHFKTLRNYSRTIVRELENRLDSEAGDSFVGLFMKAAQANGETLDEELIVDSVLNFLIAGRDTTAQAMSWCIFCIMQNPEVEAKIIREAEEVFGGKDAPLSYELLGKLNYLEAVIKEGLRLYPSVPINAKLCQQDDTLPDGTFVPGGCVVWYIPYAMGRSTELWGEDAAQFRPERWLEMSAPPSPYVYPVFHAGPREFSTAFWKRVSLHLPDFKSASWCCSAQSMIFFFENTASLGSCPIAAWKRLAMVEMKALLCSVLREVKLSLSVPASLIKPDLQLTIGMSSGLPCRVSVR